MERIPTRDTSAAETRIRRSWHGLGHLSRTEKTRFGAILHDTSTIVGTICFVTMPVLYAVLISTDVRVFGVTGAAVLSIVTISSVGIAIRGGIVHPPGTDTPGWLSYNPWLVLLRIVYYNIVLAVAIFGSVIVADSVGLPVVSLIIAFSVSLAAGLILPRVADLFYYRVAN